MPDEEGQDRAEPGVAAEPALSAPTPTEGAQPTAVATGEAWRAPASDEEWEQFLADDEQRRRVLSHPALQGDLSRAVQSAKDREIARERQRWEREQAQRVELKRVQDMDNEEYGSYVRGNEQARAISDRVEQEVRYESLGILAFDAPDSLKLPKSFDREAFARDLGKAKKWKECLVDGVSKMAEALAKEMAEPLVKKGAQALYEARLAAEREKEASPDAGRSAASGRRNGALSIEEYRAMSREERMKLSADERDRLTGALMERSA